MEKICILYLKALQGYSLVSGIFNAAGEAELGRRERGGNTGEKSFLKHKLGKKTLGASTGFICISNDWD